MSITSRLLVQRVRASPTILRRTTSSAGIVRIVKSPELIDSKENIFSIGNAGIPLMNRGANEKERTDRVAIDVRVGDVFRQYRVSPSKTNLMSVLENLSLMNINSSLLIKFPGFVQLVDDLSKYMKASQLTTDEFVSVAEILSRMKLKPGAENSGIDAVALASGFSNQLIASLDSISKVDLTKTLLRIRKHMQLDLDAYFNWALSREINRWASDKSVSDEEYVREVLGPLQALAQDPLRESVKSVFANPAIENRIIDLIRANKLNSLQTLELVTNFKAVGFPRMIQVAIASVVSGYKDQLASSVSDLSALVAALPGDGSVRHKSLQRDLVGLVLGQVKAGIWDPKELKLLLESVAGVILDPAEESETEILVLSAPLILDNALVVNKLEANRVADLLYNYATASLACSERYRQNFLEVCAQIESVVVGKMPQIDAPQLAKLSLAFGSGILSHTNSFKALGATIRGKSKTFSPHQFVDAIYGLAFRGILAKSTLVEGNVYAVAQSAPTGSLAKLAWSAAVADYNSPGLWDPLLQRIEQEVLLKPNALESLSKADKSMLYEALVAVKTNKKGHVSKNGERRIGQFETSWNLPVEKSEEQYPELLEKIGIGAEFNRNQTFAMLELPVYLEEFKLVIDATKTRVAGEGLTHGSVKLRHSLWAKMGYNVIALSDSQFPANGTLDKKAQILGSIISEFVGEVRATKSPPLQEKPRHAEWTSRVRREPVKDAAGDWRSRSAGSSKPAPNQTDWSSRGE